MKRYPPPSHAWCLCRGAFGPCSYHLSRGIPVAEVRAAWSRDFQYGKKLANMWAAWGHRFMEDTRRAFRLPAMKQGQESTPLQPSEEWWPYGSSRTPLPREGEALVIHESRRINERDKMNKNTTGACHHDL